MKRSALVSLVVMALVVVALLLAIAAPSFAWNAHHGHRHPFVRTHVFVGVGPAYYWGRPYPYWWHYPPPYYVYSPPPVIVQEPPVYTQQPVAPPAPAAQSYWYYCQSAKAYYPYVDTCPEAWVPVPPRTQ